MRKIMIFTAFVVGLFAMSFIPVKKSSPPTDPPTTVRLPACHFMNDLNGQNLEIWATVLGGGMAMQGYVNIVYEDHCCTDACYAICASICGTPPGGIYVSGDVERKIVYNDVTVTNAKAIGEEMGKRMVKEHGIIQKVTVKDNTVTVTYLSPN